MPPKPNDLAMKYEPPNKANPGETSRGLIPGYGRGGLCGTSPSLTLPSTCRAEPLTLSSRHLRLPHVHDLPPSLLHMLSPTRSPPPLFAEPASPVYAAQPVAMTPLAQERIEMHHENQLAKQERKEEHQQAKDERKAKHQQAKDERKAERLQRKEERKDEQMQRKEERKDEKMQRKEERRDERVQHAQARKDEKVAATAGRKQ